ncbi:hypothetical protein PWT90_03497 [Aphanocladium album]|nr:hypothetical protein PWT90_03497 [Aphanocladium album]
MALFGAALSLLLLLLPSICTAELVTISGNVPQTAHRCVGRCLDDSLYTDIGYALNCARNYDNRCYCPTEAPLVSKATSFIDKCASASCAAGDIKVDSPLILSIYATYCFNAGFTQPAIAPTDAPAGSPTPSSPQRSSSQPSKTSEDEPGTTTQWTTVTATKTGAGVKSSQVFLAALYARATVHSTTTIFSGEGGGGSAGAGGSGNNPGVKIGVGVGVGVAGLAALGFGLWFYLRKRAVRRRHAEAATASRRREQEEWQSQQPPLAQLGQSTRDVKAASPQTAYSVSSVSPPPMRQELMSDGHNRYAEAPGHHESSSRHEAPDQSVSPYYEMPANVASPDNVCCFLSVSFLSSQNKKEFLSGVTTERPNTQFNTMAASPITLNLPSKYGGTANATSSPSLDALTGTWTVTHSTLSMWRSAQNVRITYKPLEPKADGSDRLDDLVEYEPAGKQGVLKTVAGVDTRSSADGGWDWRGKGLLFFVTSHWEVLGHGERAAADGSGSSPERWAVTWFAPTLFTKEGIDVYSSRREGISEELYAEINQALLKIDAQPLVDLTKKDMRPVEIKLPWTEK